MAFLKLEKLRARERWGLGLALVFVLVLMVDRLVVGMVADRVETVEEQAAADAKELDYNRGVLRSKGPIEAEYSRIEALIASELSDSEEIDAIKAEIEDLAGSAGVAIIGRMEHRPPVTSAGSTEYVIDIREFEAPMAGLLSFLHQVWQTPGMMRVRKVAIAPSADDQRVEGTMVVSKIMIPTGPGGAPEQESLEE